MNLRFFLHCILALGLLLGGWQPTSLARSASERETIQFPEATSSNNYLAAQQAQAEIQTANRQQAALDCPDLDRDGNITRQDLDQAAASWHTRQNQPGWDDRQDINNDGRVDIQDMMLVSKRYGSACLPPAPETVAPPLETSQATTMNEAANFLFSGPAPIQAGVISGTISAVQVGVFSGLVTGGDNLPLSGVQISVLHEGQYGRTLSRADGGFDLAVNGGGELVIAYEKDGYLPVQRQEYIPWQDYTRLPDVVMLPVDAAVTEVNLGGVERIPDAFSVVRGSAVSDADGSRQAVLLVPPGVTAEMALPDGSRQPLTTLHIRATEFTVGDNGDEAMPAELPPASGYTYAVEYSVDEALAIGATDVYFSQDLYHYLENFLGFPVGTDIPSGYYDRSLAAWVAAPDGRVIQIISIAAGMANLDTDGDDLADNDPALGISDAERQALAGVYGSKTLPLQLWRAPIRHFTPWDCNFPYGPPSDAQPPTPPPLVMPGQSVPENNTEPGHGSIQVEDRILTEQATLIGTPYSLVYSSGRVPGRVPVNQVEIPLTGSALPPSLKQVIVKIEVSGRVFLDQRAPAVNDSYSFAWDGLDRYQRAFQGNARAKISIGYVYDGVYQEPANFEASFGLLSGVPMSGNRSRREITLWKKYDSQLSSPHALPSWDQRGLGLGGWSLDIHHAYDPTGRVLYLGSGEIVNVLSTAQVMSTFAGTGASGYAGDGGPAREAVLSSPKDITVGPDGSVYFTAPGLVRRVSPDGIISTYAGCKFAIPNPCQSWSEGMKATEAQLSYSLGIGMGADGTLFIADTFHNPYRVLKVTLDGRIYTVAGGGSSGLGDGGPATQAQLWEPRDVAVAPDGSFYISDYQHHRVRHVGVNGIITTAAGNGELNGYNPTGDGGPATQAVVYYPNGLDIGPDGSLYIASGSRVRRVTPDGIIHTFAGGGTLTGEDIPANQAKLPGVIGLDISPDGSELYLAAPFAYKVLRVDANGLLATLAGTGKSGNNGSGGLSAQIQLNNPYGVAAAPDGRIFVADYGNNLVREVARSLPGFSATDLLIPSRDGNFLYQFNAAGRHLRTLNSLSGQMLYEFEYNENRLLVGIVDSYGSKTSIERDALGNPQAVVGPFGQRTSLALDANGYLNKITRPDATHLDFEYTAGGLLTRVTDPRSGAHTFSYLNGYLAQADDPGGGRTSLASAATNNGFIITQTVRHTASQNLVTTYQFEKVGSSVLRYTTTYPDGTQRIRLVDRQSGVTTLTQANGTVTQVRDAPDPRFGWQAAMTREEVITSPNGLVTTSFYTRTVELSDKFNLLSLARLVDKASLDGVTTVVTYTAATRTFTSRTPEGRLGARQLDAHFRVLRSQQDGLPPYIYTYDSYGRRASLKIGEGAQARTYTYTYNSQGWLASLSDPAGRTARWVYDLNGRVTQYTMLDGRSVQVTYDAAGNPLQITPPGRSAHQQSYDAFDHLSSYNPPDVTGVVSDTMRYTYYLNRLTRQMIDPQGNTLTYGYSADGLLGAITHPLDAFNLSYNAQGLLGAVNSAQVNLAFAYDGGLLTGATWSGAAGVAGSFQRTYDERLRVSATQVNARIAILYQYDDDNLLLQAGPLYYERDLTAGQVISATVGSVKENIAYNAYGLVSRYSVSCAGAPCYQIDYSYDNLNRVTQKVELAAGQVHTTTLAYTGNGWLSEVRRDGALVSTYTYDANGNRLSENAQAASYDAQDRLLTYGTNSYTYTASGQLRTRTNAGNTTTYTYDLLGNLRTVDLPGTNQDIVYLIDGMNHRVGKKVGGVLKQAFLYDGSRLVAELDGSGNVVSEFIYGIKPTVPELMLRGGKTYRLVSDGRGSVRLVIDTASGAVTQQITYDEFGKVLSDSSPGFQPFGFAGGLYDAATGLTRFVQRDYDAAVGRWTTKDPTLFTASSPNLYEYALNDPNTYIDPTGLDSEVVTVGINGTVAMGGGMTGGIGLVFDQNYNVGFYYTGGTGLQASGPGVSLTGGIGFYDAPNGDITTISGMGDSTGGSGGEAIVAGGDYNVSYDQNGNVIATGISVNGGIGVSVGPPAEMHTYRTQTGVVSLNTNIFDGFWKGIYGKDIEYPNWEGHKVRPGWFEKKGF